jgi:hypothetical protein
MRFMRAAISSPSDPGATPGQGDHARFCGEHSALARPAH